MPFTSCGGCLKNIFITEAEIIDRFVGNQLWLWGTNAAGQLGNNAITSQSSPVQTISGGTNWKQVSSGASVPSSIAAIKTDGTLWVWGNNNSGQLGNNAITSLSSPVQTISGGTNWKQVSVGGGTMGAIKTDGTLWLWGTNAAGQLGTNSTVNQSSPVQTISGGTNWKQVDVGGNVSLEGVAAIKTDGSLWLWGSNGCGQLGNNAITSQSSPVQTISGGTNWKQVSFGGTTNTAAIKTDGTLWLWGDNDNGQLGTNNTVNQSSPVQTISGGTNWKQVSVGKSVIAGSVAAIKTDGTLWLWGTGTHGRLGNNNTIDQSSPVQTVSGGTNWKQVSNLNFVTSAIKTDGTLWIWGCNGAAGLLGTNSTVNQSSPVQTISGGTNWKQVSVGFNIAAVTFTES